MSDNIQISTLSHYIDIIQARQDFHSDSVFFYRGQCNTREPLPSVFRDSLMEKEEYLYHELILRCPESFSGLTHLDTLVKMQHYGLPTRLLDVTTNPLVALYFACKKNNGNYSGAGYVYIYEASSAKIAYSDSDRVLMLSCLPVFGMKDKIKMMDIVEKGLPGEQIKKNSDGHYPASLERLFHEITKEIPAFKREIKRDDLLLPLFVKPRRANDRILKQDGAFIISGLCKDKTEAESRINSLCSRVIQVNNREIILHELDTIGVNEASLFPEVEKVATYLKNKCLKRL